MENIGDRIRRLRISMGYTQKELADKLGIKPSTVGMYEQGRRRPDSDMIVKICNVFSVTADSLLGVNRSSDEMIDILKNITESLRRDGNIMLNGALLTHDEREMVIRAIEVAANVALLSNDSEKNI